MEEPFQPYSEYIYRYREATAACLVRRVKFERLIPPRYLVSSLEFMEWLLSTTLRLLRSNFLLQIVNCITFFFFNLSKFYPNYLIFEYYVSNIIIVFIIMNKKIKLADFMFRSINTIK